MDRITNLLLYGGETKETYEAIRPELVKSNRFSILVFTLIAAAGMAAMVFASFFVDSVEKNRITYLASMTFCLVLALISWHAKGESRSSSIMTHACVYAFIMLLYAFGIVLGTIIEPNETSVSFPVLLFAAPLLFVDIPLRMASASVLGILAYTVAAMLTQTSTMVEYNMSSIIPYGIISIVISSLMMRTKIHRVALERENKQLIETDQLTGLLNRRSFDQHMHILRNHGVEPGTLICTFDVNGLKATNDNIGHHAGDELINSAASAIQGVFGPYGRCYRVGGDEFMAVLEGAHPTPEELRDALALRCSCFHGTFVSGLSISMGEAVATGDESVYLLVRMADKAMYQDKTRYYMNAGIDRRRRA